MNMGFGFDAGFTMFQIMFSISFVLIAGVFVFIVVKGLSQWNKNNNSPRLTVDAVVVTKRTNYSGGSHTGNMHTSGHTSYYVTFQVNSGDRMELHVDSYEYGMLVEGDRGKLTFQGTRYLGFQRM